MPHLPDPARALLGVGHLRAECARLGIREVAVAKPSAGAGMLGWVARVAPVSLRTSARIRLQRVQPKAIYKEDISQLVLPVPPGTDPAPYLVEVLRELVPAEEPSVVSAAP